MRAVFLDRDGVINRNLDDHVRSIADLEFIPGALDALAKLNRAALPVIVVTNQSQVGRGLNSQGQVDAVNQHLCAEVEKAGGRIAAVQTCYHAPWDACACRKPRPGMLLEAAARFNIDLRRSYMVGDAISDLRAGISAGCHTGLVRTGRGLNQLISGDGTGLTRSHGVLVLADLAAAADWILHRERISLPAVAPVAVPAAIAAA